MPQVTLHTIADIRAYFANNTTPYYFISASNFNLMDMHRWVGGWMNINLLDCFDGKHPQVLIAEDNHARLFESIEDVNAYLLTHEKTRVLLQQSHQHTDGQRAVNSRAIFLFFDETLEKMCQQLNIDICLPKNSLVREIDSKIVTTEIGNQAGVHSVPNVLTKVTSYADLCQIAAREGLGARWVVQSAYGDSGKTTFFIANESDYNTYADQIESEDMVKVMRWIRCTGTAIEACATRWGTYVGPLLTEMIGIESLTPYAGGWCGNELYSDAFSDAIRAEIMHKTQAMGDALYARGYRGYFELDYLIDLDTHAVYLGELNARITGISAMTNMSDFSDRAIPLFLFHLLEYDPAVDVTVDVQTFNQQMLQAGAQGTAAQVILKHTTDTLEVITQAPVTGVYQLVGDQLVFKHASVNRRDALAADEAFVLRIMTAGEYAYKGGDLAIMFVNHVIRESSGQMNVAGNTWINALKQAFSYRPLTSEERALLERYHHPANIKSSGA